MAQPPSWLPAAQRLLCRAGRQLPTPLSILLCCRRLQGGEIQRLLTSDGRPLVLDSCQAGRVGRALVQRSPLGRSKSVMLKLLAHAGDRSHQVRA